MAVKKQGRNKKTPNAKAYLAEGRQIKNKKLKIARHQKEHPNDNTTIGTVPDYRTTKTAGYLFGAVPKRLSSSSKRTVNGRNSKTSKTK